MAMLGDMYIFVTDENIDSNVSVSEHPVETGINVTDHIRPQSATLSLNGEVVGADWESRLNRIKSWQRNGHVLSYIGRNIFHSAQIQSFSYQFTNKISGGFSFSMTLKEIRIASNMWEHGLGYRGSMKIKFNNGSGTWKVVNLAEKKNRFHTLMAGETLYYLAQQYRAKGVTVSSLKQLNRARAVFRPGHRGNYEYLLPNARIFLGVW